MARWKLGPQGAYFDPNDDGPNQVDPPMGATGQGQAGGMPQPIGDGTTRPWSEQMSDGQGGYYNPGGHVDQNGAPVGQQGQSDMSGWPRKSYPGGVGGPMPPGMGGDGWVIPAWQRPGDVENHKSYGAASDGPFSALTGSVGLGGVVGTAPRSRVAQAVTGLASGAGRSTGAFGALTGGLGSLFGVRR